MTQPKTRGEAAALFHDILAEAFGLSTTDTRFHQLMILMRRHQLIVVNDAVQYTGLSFIRTSDEELSVLSDWALQSANDMPNGQIMTRYFLLRIHDAFQALLRERQQPLQPEHSQDDHTTSDQVTGRD